MGAFSWFVVVLDFVGREGIHQLGRRKRAVAGFPVFRFVAVYL
jgi:hypothetical protein